MKINDFIDYQKRFDGQFGWNWDNSNEEEKIDRLKASVICLAGEVGEYANLIKKMLRHYSSTKEMPKSKEYDKLKEEVIDIFIYLIKTIMLLDIDLEKEYLKKMEYNQKRFEKKGYSLSKCLKD